MTTKVQGGEFIGRETQLPPDMGFAPAESPTPSIEKVPLGTPPDCYDVRSTYDVRPVNAYDFNIVASSTIDEYSAVTFALSFTVPHGMVAVLREFELFSEPVYGANRSDVLVTLTRNGDTYPQNQDLPVGSDSSRKTVFLIADEQDVIGLRVTISAVPGGGEEFDFYAWFYGNLLTKQGRAVPFEIANRVISGACSPDGSLPQTVPTKVPPPKPMARTTPPKLLTPAPAPVAPASAAPPSTPVAAPLPPLRVVNVVGSGGHRGQQKVGVFDPANSRSLGGVRAITRAEYNAHKAAIDRFYQESKRLAPAAVLWIE